MLYFINQDLDLWSGLPGEVVKFFWVCIQVKDQIMGLTIALAKVLRGPRTLAGIISSQNNRSTELPSCCPFGKTEKTFGFGNFLSQFFYVQGVGLATIYWVSWAAKGGRIFPGNSEEI